MRRREQRLAALEVATPLVRAELLAARHVPPEQWSDAELEAFVHAHCADLMHLTDEELEALLQERAQ